MVSWCGRSTLLRHRYDMGSGDRNPQVPGDLNMEVIECEKQPCSALKSIPITFGRMPQELTAEAVASVRSRWALILEMVFGESCSSLGFG